MKTCTKCRQQKTRAEFPAQKRCRDGLSSWCKECARGARKRHYAANRERILAERKADRAANPRRERKQRDAQAAKRYGITLTEYHELMRRPACECCGVSFHDRMPGAGRAPKRHTRHIDHDHNTGTIRGVLCDDCNVGIGRLGDSLAGVLKAVRYLGG